MELKEYLSEFNKVWKYIKAQGAPDGIHQIAQKRIYVHQSMLDTLDKYELVYLDRQTFVPPPYEKVSKELGLFTDPEKTGKEPFFLLTDRFVIPIKDIAGNVIALVGWQQDNLKYVTSASQHFSKSTMYFGQENLLKPRDNGMGTWVVEGIFDRLALESLGCRAFATMGINTDKRKQTWFSLMGRIVGAPDNDTSGRRVVKNDEWNIPIGSSYFKWQGNYALEAADGEVLEKPIKDVDEMIKLYDNQDIKELLSGVYSERNLRRVSRLI